MKNGEIMELSVQLINIKVGKHKVVLNDLDAKELGVMAGDRVKLKDHGYITAIVDTTDDIIPQGTIGVYHEIMEHINDAHTLEITPATKPASVSTIKHIMDGGKYTREDMYDLVNDIVKENLSDIEMTAFITASHMNCLPAEQTEWLTRAMIDTGEKLDFDTHPIMDKHSIGGVPGNKISLLIVPIVAAAGLLIPKSSSRAITGAGGTADLMEILAPVAFNADEIKSMTEKVGGVIVWGGATNIAPADDKLIRVEYPLSLDPSCQLLASIMAKKGAMGADCVVIDIPTGSGTKIPDVEQGRAMARGLIDLGARLGMQVECAMTFGASPIGRTVGGGLEVVEALKVLESMEGPNSLIQKSVGLAGLMLEMGGAASRGDGRNMAYEILKSGKAMEKMREIIEIQGGNPGITSSDIPIGDKTAQIFAPSDGYIVEFHNKRIVEIARLAGAPNDKGAGVLIHKKKGETVKKDEPILSIYSEKEWKLTNAINSAKKDYPIIVEGMLLETVRGQREL